MTVRDARTTRASDWEPTKLATVQPTMEVTNRSSFKLLEDIQNGPFLLSLLDFSVAFNN